MYQFNLTNILSEKYPKNHKHPCYPLKFDDLPRAPGFFSELQGQATVCLITHFVSQMFVPPWNAALFFGVYVLYIFFVLFHCDSLAIFLPDIWPGQERRLGWLGECFGGVASGKWPVLLLRKTHSCTLSRTPPETPRPL